VTRRLSVVWPDPRPFAGRDGAPIRLLAVSDDIDPTLDHEINRTALGRLDGICRRSSVATPVFPSTGGASGALPTGFADESLFAAIL